MIESDGHRLLIDTPPELRLQLAGGRDRPVDAVLFTHDHADHVHGIDDLRAISVKHAAAGSIPVYGPPDVLAELARRFNYIFDRCGAAARRHEQAAAHGARRSRRARPSPRRHRRAAARPAARRPTSVYGYRVGPIAYLTDVKSVPDAGARAAGRPRGAGAERAPVPRPHPLHLSIPEAVAAAQAIGARRTLLTHLTHETAPRRRWRPSLPPGIEPAYDGLVVEVGG